MISFRQPVAAPVDYRARLAFLRATSIWKPSPLAQLAKVEPTFRVWLQAEGMADLPASLHGFSLVYCRWERLNQDQSHAGRAAAEGIRAWKAVCPHLPADAWIFDAACTTVTHRIMHNDPGAEWQITTEGFFDLRPSLNLDMRELRRPEIGESPEEYRRRFLRVVVPRLNANVKHIKGAYGERFKAELDHHERDARWCARYLARETYEDIGNPLHGCDGAERVRKAVTSFARRIRLTLPRRPQKRINDSDSKNTLAETLAGTAKKHG